MHPEHPKPLENNSQIQPKPVPYRFETSFQFRIPDLNAIKKGGYIKMFEAAWNNDLETVKSITLAPWALEAGLPLNLPLKIAVQDGNGFSPFSIAVLRGHHNLAKNIVEICAAQYDEDEGLKSRKRWIVSTGGSDDCYSEGSCTDELPIYSECKDYRAFYQMVRSHFLIPKDIQYIRPHLFRPAFLRQN